MSDPIFITGSGIVCSIGVNKREVLDSLLNGKSGISVVKYLKTAHKEFPAGEVQLSDGEMCSLLGIPEGVPTTRTSLMGMLALQEALEDAGLKDGDIGRTAFISGTTVGGMDKSEQYYLDFLANDSRNEYIATHDCGSCSEMIADHFGSFAVVTTTSTACSSAANAIILAANMIKNGIVDIAIAGGSECITKFHLNGFNSLMILDKEPCRPFDKTRAGLNLGEGAAYIVLESARSAASRGRKPLCVLSGYGNACDAFHQTASSPDGEGAYRAMKIALAEAGIEPSQVDYINAHGTGTSNNDVSESQAVMRLFGPDLPPISSTKSFTGHTTSASGSVELAICMLALKHQFLPLNLNWQYEDEGVVHPVTDSEAKSPIEHILCNSFGFGGNDSSLLISKWNEQ